MVYDLYPISLPCTVSFGSVAEGNYEVCQVTRITQSAEGMLLEIPCPDLGGIEEVEVKGYPTQIRRAFAEAAQRGTVLNLPARRAATLKSYGIGETLPDGSVYIGLSAADDTPLATTPHNVGLYESRDVARIVSHLDIHGGKGWRLPLHDERVSRGSEILKNLFHKKFDGALQGTFNMAQNGNDIGSDQDQYWASYRGPDRLIRAAFSDHQLGAAFSVVELPRSIQRHAQVRPVRPVPPALLRLK